MKVLLFAVALALLVAPAEAASKKRHSKSYRTYSAPLQIACTQYGCMQVPRGCQRAPGRTPDGSPSGFDVIVCDGGAYTLYGRR
jgi:hypothetical protein